MFYNQLFDFGGHKTKYICIGLKEKDAHPIKKLRFLKNQSEGHIK